MATQTSIIDTIPGGRAAYNAVLSKVGDFNRVPQRLLIAQQWLNRVLVAARAKQDNAAVVAASAVQDRITRLQGDYASAAAGVADVLQVLRTAGLMDLDVGAVFNMVQVGGQVMGTLAQTDQVEQDVRQLASGAGVQIGGTAAGWLLYAGLGWLGYRFLFKRRRV